MISSFTSGPGSSTLPMVVFSKVRLGVSPEINVLATLTIGRRHAMIVGVSLWMARRAKLDAAEAQLLVQRLPWHELRSIPYLMAYRRR